MDVSSERGFINGTIWTGDSNRPWAEAIAVSDGLISRIGSTDEILDSMHNDAELVDLNGAFVVPGFIDNHTHFLSGGFQLASVNLRTAASRGEFVDRMQEFVEQIPDGRWVTGGDWDHEAWGGDLPTMHWIDAITSENPVFVTRLDGHMGLANSLALELAGISDRTPDPPGGTIVRNTETGEPTGVLKDEAMNLVYSVIPEPSNVELDEAFGRATDHAVSMGVTQIHDVGSFGGWTDSYTFRRAYDAGHLRIRVYSVVPVSTVERLRAFTEREGIGDHWLWWGGLKGFIDGSLGSTTAWFQDPYVDEPHTNGLVVVDTTEFRKALLEADASGFQLVIHAIGDRANEWLLSVFEEVARTNGERDRRPRIEHAQHLKSSSINRFAELGVTASMQPYHAIDDGRWAEKRIGPDRIKTTYAFRSLLDAGANVSFGSDWTVAPLNPLSGIYAAVTRRTIDGQNPSGWVPEQKITVEQALRAYTANAAFAGFADDFSGFIREGYVADLTVLSENLFEIDPATIPDVTVQRTVVGGHDRYIADP